MNDPVEIYNKALEAYRANKTHENLKAMDAALMECPWVKEAKENPVTEGIYEADTFRDHDRFEQIMHDYEVWDRHYG